MRVGVLGSTTGLAGRLLDGGLEVVAHPAGDQPSDGPDRRGVQVIGDYAELLAALEHPRLIILDVPIGATIDRVIDSAYLGLEPGDVVLDPSPSYWCDTLRRYRRMRHRSIFYVDVALLGTTGGVLVAGDDRGVDLAMPLLARLSSGAATRAGGSGAAHYALMVRAAVATAVAHALGEARQLLEAFPNHARADAVAQHLPTAAPTPDPMAAWLLDDAVRLQAAVPILAQGVMLELASALDEQRNVELPPRVGGFVHPDDLL